MYVLRKVDETMDRRKKYFDKITHTEIPNQKE